MITKYIERVNIIGTSRVAKVRDGDRECSHGLGLVGEDLMPYLGARSEGYEIALPDRPPAVYVIHVELPALPSGFYRRSRVDWEALGAPDVTLAEWGE
jgi:hypothetical protein